MLKKLSAKTNFILIGIVIGLFVGVSIRQAWGDSTDISGTARADNLTVNMAANAENGLAVANGNLLVPNGNIGIGTTTPTAKLDVVGDIKSTTQLCVGATCVTESELQTMKDQIQLSAHPGVTIIHFTKIGSGTIKVNGGEIGLDRKTTTTYAIDSSSSLSKTVSFVSVPDSGSKFVQWSGGSCGTESTCSIRVNPGEDADINVTIEFASTSVVTPPPSSTTCTGNHPVVAEGNGVVLSPYTTVAVGGGGASSPNTEWKYGEASCGWSCIAPMEQNGDIGCKAPVSGSGVTVTINNLSTGQLFPGVNVLPVSVIGISTTAALGMNGERSGIFTTGTDGKTAEFKFGNMGWTQMEIKSPGYKIRSATGCGAKVSIYANRQLNQCPGAFNERSVTINMVPGDISTPPTTHFEKLTYHRGETLKGSITGGDPNDTWGCMNTPSTASDRLCNSGRTDAWRKLTVPYDGHADGWQLIETNQGDSIQLGGLLIEQGFPLGTYTQYVKTGQWGTPSQTTSKSITVVQ